jgi:plasmid stabilization system protein ParE
MSFTVITLPEAEDDLYRDAIWWAQHHSLEQAQRWWDGIWPVINALADRPEQWPLAPENGAFEFELRERHFGLGARPTHRIFFTIRADKVYVLAVNNAARDKLKPGDIGPLP